MRFRQLLGLVIALASGLAAAQQPSPAACPPQVQPPTQSELLAGLLGASDRGLLWRITRDGRTSYLYGSIHVGKLAWAFPGPQIRAALMASHIVALEIDVTDPGIAARLTAAAQTATPTIAPGLHERIARQATAACVPEELLAHLHPVMQAVTLTVLAARWQGLCPRYAQEFVLGGFARAAQRQVVSLESPELQMRALIPRASAKAERLVTQVLDQLEQGVAQRVMARLAAAWERGDLDEIADYARWCECVASDEDRLLMQRLNDDRNPALADSIEALHREGWQVFAAVGALHMSGPQALPALMQSRGFTVQRVPLQ